MDSRNDVSPAASSRASLVDWLDERETQVRRDGQRAGRRAAVYSLGRLGGFVVLVAAWWISPHSWAGVAAVSAAGIALFLFCRSRLRQAQDDELECRGEVTVLEESRAGILSGPRVCRSPMRPRRDLDCPDLQNLISAGASWALTRQELDDLDVYAQPLGLFGLLNRCSSDLGADRLADLMERPSVDIPALTRRQEAVRWLAEHRRERHYLMGAAAALRDQNKALDAFCQVVSRASALSKRLSRVALAVWTAAAPLIVAGMFVDARAGYLILPLLIVNYSFIRKDQQAVLARIRPWLLFDRVVSCLEFCCARAAESLPSAGLLGELKERLVRGRPGFDRLCRHMGWLTLGLAGPLHAFINALVFWDLHWLHALERVYLGHRTELLAAVAALSELEALLSMAALSDDWPLHCYPRFEPSPVLRIEHGLHPLLDRAAGVANPVALDANRRICIITGSNMSGKSTYLRMIGQNALLAQIGAPVPAKDMIISPLKIMTDLRIRDDLSRKESYYLAEVRQIHRMLTEPAGGPITLCLLDELFRGTNSDERVAAAVAVVKAIRTSRNFCILATHDWEITVLGDGEGPAFNLHFAEHLVEGRLNFDYTLQDGPAQTRNAILVLQQERYPAEVIDEAGRYLEAHAKTRGDPRDKPGEAVL